MLYIHCFLLLQIPLCPYSPSQESFPYSYHLLDIICTFEMFSFWISFTTCLDSFWSLLSISGTAGLLQLLPCGRWPARTVLTLVSPLGLTLAFSFGLNSNIKKKFIWRVLPALVCLCVVAASLWWQIYCSMCRFCWTETFIPINLYKCTCYFFICIAVCYGRNKWLYIFYSCL